MKKTILWILLIGLIPLALACKPINLTEETPMGAMQLCIISQGKWIPDVAGHSIDDGTCICGENRHWDSSKGCRDNVESSGSSGSGIHYDTICDLDKKATCNLKMYKLKAITLIKDKKEYQMYYWGTNKNDKPILRIDNKGKWVFLKQLADKKLMFRNNINPKIDIKLVNTDHNNLFLRLNRGK